MDLVCQTPRLPVPGETILGTQFHRVPGGKGANQAVAIARLDSSVTMVGRVGEDAFGQTLISSLKSCGVVTDLIRVDPTHSTGVAVIVVDEAGNNHIVVVPGANDQVNDLDVERWAAQFQAGDIVLMQFEIPLAAVLSAAAIAQEKGGMVILDPAPARIDLPEPLLGLVDILTPNQVEASQLVGFSVTDVSTAVEAAQVLRQRGARAVIVKLGAAGVVVADQKTCWHQPAIAVPVLDTVAAGDAFNGGLAVGWAEGLPLVAAVQWATAVAAYCVTQRGAQAAMPTRSQIAPLLAACPQPQPWAGRSL